MDTFPFTAPSDIMIDGRNELSNTLLAFFHPVREITCIYYALKSLPTPGLTTNANTVAQ